MAKSKSFFGLRRGSTKTLTFQVLDGQQITKDRVSEVRNPNTQLQRIQRVIMNTALRAYSGMYDIVNHSWEGVSYGGKTQQKFISANIKACRARLAAKGDLYKSEKAFVPVGLNYLAPNAYVVSKGSLPSIQYACASMLYFEGGTTYADVISNLNAEAGDQLTFMVIAQGNDMYSHTFHFCRVILQPQNEVGENLPLTTNFIGSDGAINKPNALNEGTDLFAFSNSNGTISVSWNEKVCAAGAIILSRKVNGEWLRSSQTMAYSSPKSGYTIAQAIEINATEIKVSSDKYLNHATDDEYEATPIISSVKYNNEVLASGATIEPGSLLIIAGELLSQATIELYKGNDKQIAASATDTAVAYNISAKGVYTIYKGGELYMNFTCLNTASIADINSIQWGGEYKSVGASVDIAQAVPTALILDVTDNFDPTKLAASHAGITLTAGEIAGSKRNYTVTSSDNGSITYAGVTVVTFESYDPSEPIS